MCSGTLDDEGEANLGDDAFLDYFVMQVTWDQAMEFCAWDGGRRLPTEAEWEKAARGPAPRDVLWPWGSTYDCDRFPAAGCAGAEPHQPNRPIGMYPLTQSFYGVDDLLSNGSELCFDWAASRYYESDDSLSDPMGPAADSGFGHATRALSQSAPPYNQAPVLMRVVSRRGEVSDDGKPGPTFRCVRTLGE